MKINYDTVIRYNAYEDHETLVDIKTGYATRPKTWIDSPSNGELITELKSELSKMTGLPAKILNKISYVCENKRVWFPIQYTSPKAILTPEVDKNDNLIWVLYVVEIIDSLDVKDDMRILPAGPGKYYKFYETEDTMCKFDASNFEHAYNLLLTLKDKYDA